MLRFAEEPHTSRGIIQSVLSILAENFSKKSRPHPRRTRHGVSTYLALTFGTLLSSQRTDATFAALSPAAPGASLSVCPRHYQKLSGSESGGCFPCLPNSESLGERDRRRADWDSKNPDRRSASAPRGRLIGSAAARTVTGRKAPMHIRLPSAWSRGGPRGLCRLSPLPSRRGRPRHRRRSGRGARRPRRS
jgi:hypothetical protein